MNTYASILWTITFIGLANTVTVAQTQEDVFIQVQLEDGNAVYGNIIESTPHTVTVATIWERDIVILQSKIAEIVQVQKSKRALFEEMLVAVIDRQLTVYTGHVLSARSDSLEFRTTGGSRLMIPQDKIRRIVTGEAALAMTTQPPRIDSDREYDHWNKDRMYLLPTGFIMEPGDVYVGLHFILFPSLSIGIQKYFSLMGGLSFLPVESGQLYYLNPKVGLYQTENAGIALSYTAFGTTAGGNTYSEKSYQLIQLIGSATTGKITGTLGFGILTFDNRGSDQSIYSFGFEAESSKTTRFIAEGIVIADRPSTMLLMLGFRFLGHTVTGDLGIIANPGLDSVSRGSKYIGPYFALYFHL